MVRRHELLAAGGLDPSLGIVGDRVAYLVGDLRLRSPQSDSHEALSGLKVQIETGRVCVLRALVPELDPSVGLVRRLFRSESRVSIDAKDRAFRVAGET